MLGESIIDYIATFIEWCSGIILLIGFMKIFFAFLRDELGLNKFNPPGKTFGVFRAQIGNYILLGLDFYIISDILHSRSVRDSISLIRLGSVAVLRTLIGYFLGKEILRNP